MEKQTAFKSLKRLRTRSKKLRKASGFETLPEAFHLVQLKTYTSNNAVQTSPTHHGLEV